MNLYTLFVGIGATFGMWQVSQNSPKDLVLRSAYSALGVLAGALIGSRIGFFFWQPGYIKAAGWKAIQIWDGGLIWPGAIIGAWVAIGLIAIIRKMDIRILSDQLSPLLLPLVIMTWLACISTGSGYGAEISPEFYFPAVVNERGVSVSRFPNQWVAAIVLFLLYLAFGKKIQTKFVGFYSAVTWLVFSIHTLIFSYFRSDPRPNWQGLPVDIWAAILILTVSIIYFILVLFLRNTQQKKDPV